MLVLSLGIAGFCRGLAPSTGGLLLETSPLPRIALRLGVRIYPCWYANTGHTRSLYPEHSHSHAVPIYMPHKRNAGTFGSATAPGILPMLTVRASPEAGAASSVGVSSRTPIGRIVRLARAVVAPGTLRGLDTPATEPTAPLDGNTTATCYRNCVSDIDLTALMLLPKENRRQKRA